MLKIYAILCLILCVTSLLFPLVSVATTKAETYTDTSLQTAGSTVQTTGKTTVKVFKTENNSTVKVDMFEYLVGAVAGEMPATYCEEALKAQSVVCYTYVLWTMGKENNNEDYQITDSSSLHQCYLDKSEQMKKWGDDYEENRKIIKEYFSEFNTVPGVFYVINGENGSYHDTYNLGVGMEEFDRWVQENNIEAK